MTFSKAKCLWALLLLATPVLQAWAGLGEVEASIDTARVRMHARHSVARAQQYTLHELKMADGSRVQQYVAGNGRVFAVRWDTLYKPDLSAMLGSSFPDYASAAQVAAKRGGIQRQFRHEGNDLVVQSSAHLHVFSGYAYRRTMLPNGVSAQSIGLG
jgi:predicted heme/steroid binding protein